MKCRNKWKRCPMLRREGVEAMERERARAEASTGPRLCCGWPRRGRSCLEAALLLKQLPRSVAVIKIPLDLEGWKDPRALSRATMALLATAAWACTTAGPLPALEAEQYGAAAATAQAGCSGIKKM